MFSSFFWKSATERAVKTVAQVALLSIGTNQVDWTHLDWNQIGIVSAVGGLVSFLMSIAGSKIGPQDDPSVL